jgi:DNA-directed RNA polymerase specialized sigma24 family protein
LATAEHTLELELVKRLSSPEGDDAERALELLFQRYGPAVLGFATYLTRSRSKGARLAAEVFIALARVPPEVTDPELSVRPHLFASALAAGMAEVRSPASFASAWPADDNGLGLLARLPLEERVPIALAHFGEFTYAEVAQIVGDRPHKVRGLMERGLRRLLG